MYVRAQMGHASIKMTVDLWTVAGWNRSRFEAA